LKSEGALLERTIEFPVAVGLSKRKQQSLKREQAEKAMRVSWCIPRDCFMAKF
jgi:hypothetical protein